MKTKTCFISILLLCFLIDISGQKPFFYSSDGQKYLFTQIDSTVIIKFKNGLSYKNREEVTKTYLLKEFFHPFKSDSTTLYKLYKITNPEKIKDLKNSEDIDFVDFALQYVDGTLQGLTNQIFLKLKSRYTISDLDSIKKVYSISKIEQSSFNNSVYIATLMKNSKNNAIEISRFLYENGKFEYAEPNFVRFLRTFTSDQYYTQQWAIHNTGQFGGIVNADIHVLDAWNITKGSACIKIAVLDEGVDLTHPDLQDNLLPGYDETGNGSNGGPQGNDAHGTNVAGIISAIENNIGIIGVAPLCKIIPIRIAYEDVYHNWITDDYQMSSGFTHAWYNANADIISCSWGGGSPSSTVTNSINEAIDSGRNSKGCLVVFSAGNYNSSVLYPASLSNVIAVGATSMCDERKRSSNNQLLCNPGVSADPQGVSCDGETWWGSNYGTNLDIVAPGVHIYSTDIQGSSGYNKENGTNGNYYDSFNGTSAACPHVSAVLALILSANPDLTQTLARQILESNTDKIGNYTYSTVSGQPNGTWNNEVGYGRVNAYKAVLAALGQSISGPTLICSSGATFTIDNIPSGCTVSWNNSTNLTLSSTSDNTAIFTANASANSSGWVQATINSSTCGSFTLPQYSVWVGPPSISSQIPLAYFDGSTYNNACNLQETSTNMIIGGTSSVNWSRIAATPSSTTWYQSGDNVFFYFYNVNQTAVFNISGSNSCGTTSYDFGFKSITCGGGGGGCNAVYTLSPNPTNNKVKIIPQIPAPCNVITTLNQSGFVSVYDQQGTLKKRVKYTYNSEIEIDVSNLRNGLYIMEIFDGNSVDKKPVIVKH